MSGDLPDGYEIHVTGEHDGCGGNLVELTHHGQRIATGGTGFPGQGAGDPSPRLRIKAHCHAAGATPEQTDAVLLLAGLDGVQIVRVSAGLLAPWDRASSPNEDIIRAELATEVGARPLGWLGFLADGRLVRGAGGELRPGRDGR